MGQQERKDLYVLVADQDMLQTVDGLLNRSASLGIRPITYAIAKHIHRDPGCRTGSSHFLRGQINDYKYALVLFDRRGCGDCSSREEIQDSVELELAANGWRNRSKVVVIDPELETWVWNGSVHVPKILGWQGGYQQLKAWLVDKELWPSGYDKPPNPKNAMRAAMRKGNRSISAALFGQLARSATTSHCQDAAFAELKGTLQGWFPAADGP